jgi:hypothetical protein
MRIPQISLRPGIPRGCRVYNRAVSQLLIDDHLEELTRIAARIAEWIVAGQPRGERSQNEIGDHPLADAFLRAIAATNEDTCRTPSVVRVLQSAHKKRCRQQRLHYDYPIETIQTKLSRGELRRRPASAILAVQEGTRLLVWDKKVNALVTVWLAVGDMIIFDGDVLHAGAPYDTCHTRVHVYLDVPDIDRPDNSTWFPKVDPQKPNKTEANGNTRKRSKLKK